MMPFIKNGEGRPSWSATILFVYLVFYILVYAVGFFTPSPMCEYAQSAWDAINVGLFGVLANYMTNRGKDVYESVKTGANVKEVISNMLKDMKAKKPSAGEED